MLARLLSFCLEVLLRAAATLGILADNAMKALVAGHRREGYRLLDFLDTMASSKEERLSLLSLWALGLKMA